MRSLPCVFLAAAGALLCGCAASGGPPPRVASGAPEATSDGPRVWTETVDEALFGSSAEELDAGELDAGRESVPDSRVEATDLAGVAVALLHSGRLEETVPVIEAAVALAPEDQRADYERALGDALQALHRHDDAVRVYRAAVSRPATSARPSLAAALHGHLAVALYHLRETVASSVEARRSLDLEPDNAGALKTLGLVALAEGRTADAEELLRAAIELDPAVPEAQVALAELEENTGRLDAARDRYRRLLAEFRVERKKDYHRRWKHLFYPDTKDTGAELTRRLRSLEATEEEPTLPQGGLTDHGEGR